MSTVDLERIRAHYAALRDGELLRVAMVEGGALVPAAQEVVQEVVRQRFGTPAELIQREREKTGSLWGRIQQVQTFTRLRGPLEPVLGGRDVPPYAGVILLTNQGFGFVPSDPPNPREIFPTLPSHDSGSGAMATGGVRSGGGVTGSVDWRAMRIEATAVTKTTRIATARIPPTIPGLKGRMPRVGPGRAPVRS